MAKLVTGKYEIVGFSPVLGMAMTQRGGIGHL